MLKADEPTGTILFEETQKYPGWVKWLVRVSMFFSVAGILVGFISDERKTEMLISLAIVVPVAVLVIYLTSNIQLEKIVTSNGLYYRSMPWHKRFRVIEKQDIESITIRKFPFLRYGFGWFPTYGWYYNFGRGGGIQLYLKNGRKFFFSSREKESLERSLKSLISPNQKPSFSEY
jgi:hypothetical protein